MDDVELNALYIRYIFATCEPKDWLGYIESYDPKEFMDHIVSKFNVEWDAYKRDWNLNDLLQFRF